MIPSFYDLCQKALDDAFAFLLACTFHTNEESKFKKKCNN